MSTATLTPAPVQVPQAKNILENAILLSVVRRFPPMSKAVKDKTIVQSSAQPQMISLNKKLWDSAEMRRIVNLEIGLDNFIKFNATQMPLRAGNHLLAVDLFTKVEQRFMEHVAKREELINDFVAAFDQAIEKSKELLGDQFRSTDYPTKEQVKGLFYFGWSYLEFCASDKLKEIDKAIAARQAEQIEGEVLQAAEVQKHELREQMKSLVDHLVERLTPKENSEGELKRKVIRDSVLENITNFKEIFPAKNLAGDDKLKDLVTQTEALLTGVTPEVIRTKDDVRQSIQEGFSKIKQNLDQLIEDEPVRGISFTDL